MPGEGLDLLYLPLAIGGTQLLVLAAALIALIPL